MTAANGNHASTTPAARDAPAAVLLHHGATDTPPPQGLWLRWEGLVYDVALPKQGGRSGGKPDGRSGGKADYGLGGGATSASAPPGAKRVLHGLSGQVLPGQLLAIMGPSGSGKTSLMKLLAGRRPPTAGALLVNGAPAHVPTYRRASGFVAQTTTFLDTLTVRRRARVATVASMA